MSSAPKVFTIQSQYKSNLTDGANEYAAKTKQFLEFIDARNQTNGVAFNAFLSSFSQVSDKIFDQ